MHDWQKMTYAANTPKATYRFLSLRFGFCIFKDTDFHSSAVARRSFLDSHS
jgi:hypothetical protein